MLPLPSSCILNHLIKKCYLNTIYNVRLGREHFPTVKEFHFMEKTKCDSVNCLFMPAGGCFYTVSQKNKTPTLAHNFTKYLPVFKILSLLDSVDNL